MAKINGNDGGNNKDLMQGLQAYYEAIKAKAAGKTDKPNKTILFFNRLLIIILIL